MANREGCLWLKAEANGGPQRRGEVWDASRNRWTKVVGFDGQPRNERLPQVGFHGTDITNLRPAKRSDRAVRVLTAQGDVVWKSLTPAAAAEANDMDRHRVRREANAKGWIYVGECPIRAVHGGLRRSSLISDACKPDAAMCSEADLGVDSTGRPMPPCPHFIAEERARKAKQRGVYDREIEAGKDASAQQVDAIKDGAEATRALAAAILAQQESTKGKPAK